VRSVLAVVPAQQPAMQATRVRCAGKFMIVLALGRPAAERLKMQPSGGAASDHFVFGLCLGHGAILYAGPGFGAAVLGVLPGPKFTSSDRLGAEPIYIQSRRPLHAPSILAASRRKNGGCSHPARCLGSYMSPAHSCPRWVQSFLHRASRPPIPQTRRHLNLFIIASF
jgi:hypothetical protein